MKKQQLVIQIPAELKQWLRELAAKDDRSVSYVVAALLQAARATSTQEPTP
ncbi:hypothetical protein [Xanthomonas citri]|uniref:hypothetical protein n=1 Tax=Xanthomonas citri TaxID=346 RepID=UPI00138F79B3|nr:hypothetical protein [Xanthomonas citri]MCC8490857.1 hypothetical protein [Xanthomonas citri pv. fuscans]